MKEAGIGRKEALGVGIVVDHRRRNLSEEGKKLNVERLKAYKAHLIVFPRKTGKAKKGDSSVGKILIYFVLDLIFFCALRRMISRRQRLALVSLFPRVTPQKDPEKSLPKSTSSRHTGLFVLLAPTPGTRVPASFAPPRLVLR